MKHILHLPILAEHLAHTCKIKIKIKRIERSYYYNQQGSSSHLGGADELGCVKKPTNMVENGLLHGGSLSLVVSLMNVCCSAEHEKKLLRPPPLFPLVL